jgi:hypothetical protein
MKRGQKILNGSGRRGQRDSANGPHTLVLAIPSTLLQDISARGYL